MSGDQLSALFSWRGAIVESDLPPTTRHLALTLSLHMNERGGSCFPSISTLAHETGLNYHTVSRHLAILREHGWLRTEVRRRGEGRGTVLHHTATIPTTALETTGGLTTGGLDRDHRAPNARTTALEELGQEDVIEDDKRTSEIHRDAAFENSGGTLPGMAAAKAPATQKPKRRDELWVALVAVCGDTGVQLTSSRRGAYNAALKQIREVGGTPEAIFRNAEVYAATYETPITPGALAKNWNAQPQPRRDTKQVQRRQQTADVIKRVFSDVERGRTVVDTTAWEVDP